ncbi:MAG: gliding motility lipoprotein GldH [Bacteroidales bacterium]|nr:gliding motility lipoprotein GldH [Bacteroidales bacterium]MCB9012698.1 gliding motility lipoprotein GldH [Bacteroidales bacterium]
MKTTFALLFIFLFLSSCDPNRVYDEYQKTENGMWKWSDKKTFNVEMKDSISLFNIDINIRHTTNYPKSNLFIFVTTTAPTGASRRDTVEIIIADEHGKWEGNGFGDIKLVSRVFRKAVRFVNTGNYKFEIEQGMRMPEIPVTDVGLRVEEFVDIR